MSDPHTPIFVEDQITQILFDAVNSKASDIHFEPFETMCRIRLRCNGVLCEYHSQDKEQASRLSSKIKIMARLDIAEKRLPQDGRFKISLSPDTHLDIRVSSLPTMWGEKIVLRLLSSDSVALDIDALGLSDANKNTYLSVIHKPQGLVLITGPTGSGKTVSLYTALKLLNSTERNISTAEDPIEINLPGINQVQINDKIGLDYATTLRALLRQDPDVIMIGEIRDKQSAEIALKAAQTGHLVFATLHTNSACETITRLHNMGINYHSLATSLTLIIAQRLTRKLCCHCKLPDLSPSLSVPLNASNQYTIYQANPQGCTNCVNGYSGRVGLFEMLAVEKNIMAAIENGYSTTDIENLAIKNGFQTLKDSGNDALIKGITSIKELHRTLFYG